MVQLQVFFLPILLHGHMIPMLDMAKLFASRRGVHSTIITTSLNAPAFANAIDKTERMSIKIIKFPKMPGLPEDCENFDHITCPALIPIFFSATRMLREQVEQLLEEYQPDCLVADMFFPWATESAAKFNVPRFVFHGTSFFSLCVTEELRLNKPFLNLTNDSDEFVVPNVPHRVKLLLSQLPTHLRQQTKTFFSKILNEVGESELKSYGVIVNSFNELEPDYADHYRNVLNRRAWHIGPLLLCHTNVKEKAERGKKSSIDQDACLEWLNSKAPKSVVYVCFGSMNTSPNNQLHEIAMGLEASGQQFIWVVMKVKNDEEDKDWMPEGFEERTKGKGLIIRGWAPQLLILDHKATGAIVTHCGWNSTLEGITAGLPMVTWPWSAEQFYNEKLITEVLQIGVPVGATQWVDGAGSSNIKRQALEMAVKSIMIGEEAMERRQKAKYLKDKARKAIKEGGSSHSDLNALIKELSL